MKDWMFGICVNERIRVDARNRGQGDDSAANG
jgi:hypothetical protein